MMTWRDRTRAAWRRLVCRLRGHVWEASIRTNRVVKDCLRCGLRYTIIWFLPRRKKP